MARLKRSEALPRKKKIQESFSSESFFSKLSEEEERAIWSEVSKIRKALKNKNKESAEAIDLVKRLGCLRDKIVEKNLRYVKTIVRWRFRWVKSNILDWEDLEQEGRIGLFKAFERFDPKRGVKFNSYASWWIIQAIFNAIHAKMVLVRLPKGVRIELWKIEKSINQTWRDGGSSGVDLKIVSRETGIAPERIHNIRKIRHKFLSLDAPLGEEDDRTLADKLPDSCPTPEEILARLGLVPVVEKALSLLTEKQATVIRGCFGLGNGGEIKSFVVLGAELGVTKQRAEQIYKLALVKLRWIFRYRVVVAKEDI